jgi:hypothetical protein
MTEFHDQYLSFELKRLLQRLDDPKVQKTIEDHPSFKVQRDTKASLGRLKNRIEYVLKKIENSGPGWWVDIKRKFFPEEFDGRVARLTIATNNFLQAIGVGSADGSLS